MKPVTEVQQPECIDGTSGIQAVHLAQQRAVERQAELLVAVDEQRCIDDERAAEVAATTPVAPQSKTTTNRTVAATVSARFTSVAIVKATARSSTRKRLVICS